MRWLGYILTVCFVVTLAFWAYHENYQTRSRITEMGKLRSEISSLRQRLGLLRSEWAYLNRPDRLRELVDLNFDRLQLIPLTPEHFVRLDNIDYPAPVPVAAPDDLGHDLVSDTEPGLPGTPTVSPVPRPPQRPPGG